MILYDLKVELVYVDNNGRQIEYKRGILNLNFCKLMIEILQGIYFNFIVYSFKKSLQRLLFIFRYCFKVFVLCVKLVILKVILVLELILYGSNEVEYFRKKKVIRLIFLV